MHEKELVCCDGVTPGATWWAALAQGGWMRPGHDLPAKVVVCIGIGSAEDVAKS